MGSPLSLCRAHDLLTSTYSSFAVTSCHSLARDTFGCSRFLCPRRPHPLCSRTSGHLLQRAAHPEGTSSFRLFLCFLFHTVHTLINIFWSGYFIPLCLCNFSIHCIRIHSLSSFAITQCSSCLSWGAYRESVGDHFSLYKWFFYWECTVSVCIIYLSAEHHPSLSIWRAIYIWRDVDQPDLSIPASSKIAQIDL